MRLINYQQLEEMFQKHDLHISKPETFSSKIFQKLFVIGSTGFIVIYGVLLFLLLLPLVLVEAIITGFIRGIKHAKEIRNKSD